MLMKKAKQEIMISKVKSTIAVHVKKSYMIMWLNFPWTPKAKITAAYFLNKVSIVLPKGNY